MCNTKQSKVNIKPIPKMGLRAKVIIHRQHQTYKKSMKNLL